MNAAGIRTAGSAAELTPERWAGAIDTNLTGTFLVARAAILRMLEQGGGGVVINVSAISGFRGPAGRAAYGAAKAGVHNLTQAMALDHARDSIRVNCVAPGPTATPMVGEITPEVEEAMAKRVPLGRIGPAGGRGGGHRFPRLRRRPPHHRRHPAGNRRRAPQRVGGGLNLQHKRPPAVC